MKQTEKPEGRSTGALLRIEYRPTASLRPCPGNPRKHSPEQIKQIKQSIDELGFLDPIGLWKEEIVEGEGRWRAATERGDETVPCVILDALTDEQRRKYMILHNQIALNSEYDLRKLEAALEEFPDVDWSAYDFEKEFAAGFFQREKKDGKKRQDGNDEYNKFLEKFEAKKTTDDCYTPELVYEAVAGWVENEYGVKRADFVRPFYPGGDYTRYPYKESSAVVDNPPFSILSEITTFYTDNGIRFFLFAPTLTIFSTVAAKAACCLCCGVSITYENGACVNTSFITNLETDCVARSSPTLYKAVKDADVKNQETPELPKYIYPAYVITSTKIDQFSRYGVDFKLRRKEAEHIRQLDSQKESGKTIYGAGFLISEREKAEREKAGIIDATWKLSDRERKIIRRLSKK